MLSSLRTWRTSSVTLGVLSACLTLCSAQPAPAAPNRVDSGFSTSWTGYALDAAPGTYYRVSADVVVPGTPICSSSSPGTSSWYYWAGLDGYKSGTVEQVGVAVFCADHRPTYTAWYEAFPRGFVTVRSLRIRPGQHLRLTVIALRSHRFRLSIASVSKPQVPLYEHMITVAHAVSDSAECVAENPNAHTQALPLRVEFTSCRVNDTPIATTAQTPTSLTLINQHGTPLDTLTPPTSTGGFTATATRALSPRPPSDKSR
jgi:hypothetical protein